LLTAARSLTYTQGVGVGVDAILEAANVARRSLYQHFGGKDRLIAEVIRTSADGDVQRYRDALDAGGTEPRARLVALFDTLGGLVQLPGFHGCRYNAVELGLADPAHPAHAEARAYKARLVDLLREELVRFGHPDPAAGADQLLLLVDGTLTMASAGTGERAARAARALLTAILDGAGG
jgi:AcrR family transcriptional regulator